MFILYLYICKTTLEDRRMHSQGGLNGQQKTAGHQTSENHHLCDRPETHSTTIIMLQVSPVWAVSNAE